MGVIVGDESKGFLNSQQVGRKAARSLDSADVDGKRVLVLIPDGTRTMPMPLMFDILTGVLGPRSQQLDFLVALGTHPRMTDEQLTRHLGVTVTDGRAGAHRIFNHQWDQASIFTELGRISPDEIERLTEGLLMQEVVVSLNRIILDYDHIMICGPVFPHEVAGFSGGAKYFFPGIAGAEIIHFTHWLGALLTSHDIIGTRDTLVRRVIHRATEMIPRSHSLLALVVTPEGVLDVLYGDTVETWHLAVEISSRHHIVRVEKPFNRVLSILPEMYGDLWTGAKGMYKLEPVIADGGEIVIYAPHITEVSYVHGRMIDEIGYHCRDYFAKQWTKFANYPGGILAHSTHVTGKGTYDAETGIESPRIHVTLATGISEERCKRINLGYLNPESINADDWSAHDDWLVVPRAGEMLYRLA